MTFYQALTASWKLQNSKTLDKANWQLQKWVYNEPKLIKRLPPVFRRNESANRLEDHATIKTLGIVWEYIAITSSSTSAYPKSIALMTKRKLSPRLLNYSIQLDGLHPRQSKASFGSNVCGHWDCLGTSKCRQIWRKNLQMT